ncbi:MAG: DinB family protein [Methylocella sp.]
MIDKQFVEQMAKYNRWQNANLYTSGDALSDEDRKRERGAFFGSIHATLNHLLWADRMWMHRFAGMEKPSGDLKASVAHTPDWQDLKHERESFDEVILRWAESLDPAWFDGELTWVSGAAHMEITRPKWILVTHMFNHQTHHRGQVHCMITQCGLKPHDTDLPFMMPASVG